LACGDARGERNEISPPHALASDRGCGHASRRVALRNVNEALAVVELKARFVDLGLEPFASSPTEFGTFIVEHTETWGKIIRAANIKPN
jgi:tripartite-type tricarboxylate transporter receptor subunit TctC